MSANALADLGVRDIATGYRSRAFTPEEVTEAALARIAATEPTIHAWVEVAAAEAMEAAAVAERELANGIDRGPLHGVPVGIKDIFDIAGMATRCGSASLADAHSATKDAATVATLRMGGAVLLGKTVTQEFAAGVISAPARNPWDPTRVPGGSSGGSAAAVAVGACYVALGSDTGGSIRIPAAACGVTGFKPTFGTLAVDGVYPLSWSLDTVGPIARTVDDTELLYRVLVGQPAQSSAAPTTLKDVRIGVSREFFLDSVQPDVMAALERAIVELRSLGATVVETPWPEAAAARACSFVINRIETAIVHEAIAVGRPDAFARYGPELRTRVAAGLALPAALYLRAVRSRAHIRDSMTTLFADNRLDALLAPTLPTTAVLAERQEITGTGRDESVGAGWTRLTMPFNATGQPVLSLPCGRDRDGMPVGMQLAGKPGREDMLFAIGRAYEALLGPMRPPLPAGA